MYHCNDAPQKKAPRACTQRHEHHRTPPSPLSSLAQCIPNAKLPEGTQNVHPAPAKTHLNRPLSAPATPPERLRERHQNAYKAPAVGPQSVPSAPCGRGRPRPHARRCLLAPLYLEVLHHDAAFRRRCTTRHVAAFGRRSTTWQPAAAAAPRGGLRPPIHHAAAFGRRCTTRRHVAAFNYTKRRIAAAAAP